MYHANGLEGTDAAPRRGQAPGIAGNVADRRRLTGLATLAHVVIQATISA